jgi:hypothetical protein
VTDATVTPIRPSPAKGEAPSRNSIKQRRYRKRQKAVTNAVTRDVTVTSDVTSVTGNGVIIATTMAALALAAVSAGFSIVGLTGVFVRSTLPVIAMGVALELGKLSAVACLGRRYGSPALRLALTGLVAVLMGLNAIGAYGFLAKAHIGHQVEGETAVAGRTADIDARIAVQTVTVADLDRRIAQIDTAVEKATDRGRTAVAMIAGRRAAQGSC